MESSLCLPNHLKTLPQQPSLRHIATETRVVVIITLWKSRKWMCRLMEPSTRSPDHVSSCEFTYSLSALHMRQILLVARKSVLKGLIYIQWLLLKICLEQRCTNQCMLATITFAVRSSELRGTLSSFRFMKIHVSCDDA